MNSELVITYEKLKKYAILYISLPIFCFFVGWLQWYWSILACLALVVCFLASSDKSRLNNLFSLSGSENRNSVSKAHPDNEKRIVISTKLLLFIVLISCIYLILCGIGRLWPQSHDCSWRNAIFRDLILRDWPVFYDKYDGALCYYFGMWLPAAILGKLVYVFSGNPVIAFTTGNIAFLIYYTIGLSLLFLLLLLYFQATKIKQVLTIILGFIFFSGMDILGVFIMESYSDFKDMHIEWWSGFHQYSSLTTLVCWVFNQTIIPLVCMMLLLHEKEVANYVFIGMACLFSGPFPFIGFFIYSLAIALKNVIDKVRTKEVRKFVNEVFSISNIVATFFIFPFIGSFLTANTFMSQTTLDGAISDSASWDGTQYFIYFIFSLLEFGILSLLLAKNNKTNILFYVTVLQLLIYPFFDVGVNSDLAMRASIPAIFLLYVFSYKTIFKCSENSPFDSEKTPSFANTHRSTTKFDILNIAIIVCLVVGAVTPSVEFLRGITRVYSRGINDVSTDYIVTLNRDSNPVPGGDEAAWPATNFVSMNYEGTVFFKYFVRR